MTYLISTILLVSILATKTFFLFIGKGEPSGLLDFASLSVLISILFFSALDFFKDRKFSRQRIKTTPLNKFLIAICLFILTFSFLISFSKKTALWDSVALYDARAKFLAHGVNFSQMVQLSKYDPQNSYYYVLYPPHTSMLHFFWNSLGIPAPVTVLYSIFLVFLAIVIFVFINKRLGSTMAALLTFLTISNNAIFSSSVAEYTNLPFTLQMFLGVILLYEYLEDGRNWKVLYGSGLVITTMWIRFLEPIWLGAALAFSIATFLKKKFSKELFYPVLMILYGVLERGSWQSFVAGFGEATKIVSFSLLNFLEPIVGIFTGSMLSIFIFFVKSWGLILLVYIFAIALAFLNRKKLSFLQIFLFLTILIYYSGLYFVSFQSVWWDKLGDSLVRGSSFMIPISGYIVLEYLHGKKN